MDLGLIILILIIAVIAYAVYIYNQLVRKRQMVEEGWSGIDVQLKRRANLIPNMLAAVKGYMGHERETLDMVTKARTAVQSATDANPAERGRLEGLLSGAMGRFMAVAENYPDLKANTTFLELQDSLRTVEDEIQLSRRYYNGAVRNLNVAVESFPSNLVANQFNFEQAEYFELENAADAAVPKISFD